MDTPTYGAGHEVSIWLMHTIKKHSYRWQTARRV